MSGSPGVCLVHVSVFSVWDSGSVFSVQMGL